jgi:hypothetical protein
MAHDDNTGDKYAANVQIPHLSRIGQIANQGLLPKTMGPDESLKIENQMDLTS